MADRALESFTIDKDLVGRDTATGPIPKTLKPIFRDRDDFTAGHTLSEQTLAALDASAALIVICSPASAKSHYVNEEIRLFKSRHPERPVIPLIVDGKPADPERECFPPALNHKLDAKGHITKKPIEVLAADKLEEGDGKHLALAKIVAGLLGVSSDDIFRRAERERRRQGRIRSAIGVVMAALLIEGSLLGWQSYRQRQTIAEVEALVAKYSAVSTVGAGAGSDQSLATAITPIAEGAAGDARYAKALDLLKAGKPAEAEPLLKAVAEEEKMRAARGNTRAAAAFKNLGAVARLTDPKRARDYYAQAAALDPADGEAMYWNARMQFLAGNVAAAEQAYRRTLTLEQKETLNYWWAKNRAGRHLAIPRRAKRSARCLSGSQVRRKQPCRKKSRRNRMAIGPRRRRRNDRFHSPESGAILTQHSSPIDASAPSSKTYSRRTPSTTGRSAVRPWG